MRAGGLGRPPKSFQEDLLNVVPCGLPELQVESPDRGASQNMWDLFTIAALLLRLCVTAAF